MTNDEKLNAIEVLTDLLKVTKNNALKIAIESKLIELVRSINK